jgi:hypothetical protein
MSPTARREAATSVFLDRGEALEAAGLEVGRGRPHVVDCRFYRAKEQYAALHLHYLFGAIPVR